MVLQRKRSLFLGLGLTVALVLAVGLSPATASALSHSFSVGGGTATAANELGEGETHFAFSAHCKSATGVCPPGTGTASGYAVVRDSVFGTAQGHVCAVGVFVLPPPAAGIGIAVEKGSGLLGSAPFLVFAVADFGAELPSGSPDLFGFEALDRCDIGVGGGLNTGPVVQGNIVVKQR